MLPLLVPRIDAPNRLGVGATVTRVLGNLVLLAAIGFLGALIGVSGATTAHAHARVTEIEPADGAALSTAPARVAVTLSETPIPGAARLALTGPDGPVRLAIAAQGNAVIGKVPSQMTPGSYTLTWRVASEDGHVVSGSSTFVIKTTASPAKTSAEVAPSVPAPASNAPSSPPSTTTTPRATPGESTDAAASPGAVNWMYLGAPLVIGVAGVGYVLNRRRNTVIDSRNASE